MVNNNNYPMMFYFLRFFKKGSTHRIIGALNVSAFIFDDSTRPHASIRVGVESVSPIRELNFDGTIIGGTIPLGVIPIDGVVAPPGREYKKMRFILFKYTWENWDNKNLVSSNNAIKEAFSEYLEDLYEDLIDDELIVNNCNPVVSKEKQDRRQSKIKSSRRKVVEKGPNPDIIQTDLDSDSLEDFAELMNDDVPFSPDLFIRSASMTA
ncbi:hypothetical protein G6F33_012987 [Rhizopus arrhizus]|uniref:Uncharacterized protein n=1 Tax=Rhizopus oryzae TaxID=64495 RepID=A0A9P6WVF8_RHIOR|nr:hypothetical protein G6F24_014725 [Rhizopus arrhizus]KAG0901798.1 hypothetical protein G6F33_012987 [Rhizopus arrhizus]KAG0927409.1 hypothetical protein G6F32_012896 [Rhizopus arrhizus]KAG1271718.1 hypothetical protein G6F66_013500 [Rhizopus arrhizus]KAG1294008.1 hypothetical protein G6F64_013482 [Rhizopus arrhizus]